MELTPELNNVVIEGNNLTEPQKKIKKTKLKKEKLKIVNIEEEPIKVINKGTGAGGANTNYYGKKFEEKTNNHLRLLNNGYNKNSFTKKPKKFLIIIYPKLLKIKRLRLYYKMD